MIDGEKRPLIAGELSSTVPNRYFEAVIQLVPELLIKVRLIFIQLRHVEELTT